MAIEKKRMQQRYGTYDQFQADKENLLPNEFASVTSGDPNTSDGKGLYFGYGSGNVKRIAFSDEIDNGGGSGDGGGTGGTTNYNNLSNLPQINGITLAGNKTASDLNLQPAGNYITNEDIPKKLPNPQKIIFTGAVTAEYDGSSQQTINIPTGGGSDPYTLPIMSPDQLGGGKAVSKTDEDVPVAVDPSTGQLFVPTYPSGGDSGGKSYYYEETLEEGISKVFVPFSEFKGCKRIFAQIYIPDVSEESYNNYIPRAKIDNNDVWSSGKIFALMNIATNLNNVVIYGELVLNNNDAFFAGGGSRAQYKNETASNLNASTYGDKFTFNESETSGIYFEIYNRTNYSFPAGTKIIVVGM